MSANGKYHYSWRLLSVLFLLEIFICTKALSNQLELENELLLELRIEGDSQGFDILGYQRGDDFLLSLEELTTGLAFPITIDASQGTAEGWYISQDNIFSLSMERGEVVSGTTQWPIEDGEAVLFEGGLYVETTALEKWFPLRLFAVVRELYLDIQPTELLPAQLRANRRKRIAANGSRNQPPQYPLQETPYQLLGPHTTSLRLGYATTRNTLDSDAEYRANYATLSRGDLGWMTSTLSLSGQSEDSLSAARLKLERSAFKGPLGVSHIELGDVAASGFRGFLLQGNGGDAQLNGRIDEDSVDIEGSQLPDWDIELYQNDQLIAIQTTGPDGRYFFEDVPLQFGENRFELQFFGPNGEIESLEEYHFLGPGMLKSGHANYEISAVQNGLTVFSVNDLPETEDQGSAIYASSANFGLTSNLTISGGIESEEVNGERLQSINGGLGFSTSRLYGSLNYLDNPRAQNSLRTSLRTSLGNSNLSLSYARFFEDTELENSFAKWQAGMEITSRVFSVPVKLEANTSETLFTTQNEVALGTTVPLSGSGNFASSLWYNSFEQRLDEETTAASQAGGQSTFNTTMRPWAFRVSAVYGLQPDVELHQLSASSNLFIDNDLSLTLGLRRFSSTDTTLYNAGINWRIGELALSTSVSYDSNERWSGVITASTILVHRPYTLVPALNRRASVNSGSVEARVFEDINDSEALPYSGNTNIAAVQTWRRATTDENGMAHIHGLPAYRHTDIELDSSTIADYELRPKNQGVSVIPRPGSYTIVDFPLVRTAELEGTIYETRNNENVPIGRALILLNSLDGELVAQTRSEFDGFYLFAGVEPGDYRLTVEPTLESRVIKRPAMVSVESSSGVISGLDYTLRPTQTTPAQPSLLAEKTESQQDGEAEQTSDTAPQTLSLPTLAASLPESASNTARQAPAKPQTEKITTKPQTESPAEQGNWFVQIAAYSSRQTAQASWERIKQDVSVLRDKTAKYSQTQNMTRLLVGPGSSKEAANDLCKQLKADKLDCLVRQVE